MSKTWLWDELHEFFDTDDGSLPMVCINFGDPQCTSHGYEIIRSRASRIISESPSFWSLTHNEERAIDSVPDPAALVVTGQASAFHLVFGGIQSQGVTIPDLGVFVFADTLQLDYRMGDEWGPAEVEAFFELLSVLAALDTHATLSFEPEMLPEVEARFHTAWLRYLSEKTA